MGKKKATAKPAAPAKQRKDPGSARSEQSARSDTQARAADLRGSMRIWLEAILIALLFLRFANTFVLQTFYIPSESMVETLLIGDHLFVNRFIYSGDNEGDSSFLPQRPVERGDIVVFDSLEQPGQDIVKRCIAVAGDTVEIHGTRTLINGQMLEDDSYVSYRRSAGFRYRFGPVTVPTDHVFCMGDNRDSSYDSRAWGPLPLNRIKGRASMIYWSYSGEVSDGTSEESIAVRLRRGVGMLLQAPFRTRWDRMFDVVR